MGVSVDDFVDVGEIRGRGGGRKHSADTLKLQKWHIFVSIPTIVCDAFGLMARRICAQLNLSGKSSCCSGQNSSVEALRQPSIESNRSQRARKNVPSCVRAASSLGTPA